LQDRIRAFSLLRLVHPETGAGAGIEWQDRLFIVTANHVVKGFADSDLEGVFRPPGTLERAIWWQSNTPGQVRLMRAQAIPIVARYSDLKYDLAAFEVEAPVIKERLRFHKLRVDSKIIRPSKNTLCAIGVPFDSYEQLGPGAVALSPYALWGNAVPRWKNEINSSTHVLMEFPPAKTGREPHGFSGAGTWYPDPTIQIGTTSIWVPTMILAGIIIHYIRRGQILETCRVEKLVDFLSTAAKTSGLAASDQRLLWLVHMDGCCVNRDLMP
jgi:hypothetical protein